MASVLSRKVGEKTIYYVQCYLPDGTRKKLYTFYNRRDAERFRDNLEQLIDIRKSGGSDKSLRSWILKLETEVPDQYDKLAEWGLVPPRKLCKTLQGLVDLFLSDPQLKTHSVRNRRTCTNRLLAFFGPDKPLNQITRAEAMAFYQKMQATLAAGTWGRDIKTVKQMFNVAVELELLEENPFLQKIIKGSSKGNPSRFHFVTEETTNKVLAACRNAQERLIFSLARFGGLRIPSEIHFMEWSDIDFAGKQFTVRIPKKTSKRCQEAGQFTTRLVPMFPELQVAFLEYRQSLPSVVPTLLFPDRPTGQTLKSRFLKVLRQAGVEPWGKFFQNLRSTRETELAAKYPIQDVTQWLGNTPQTALNHYLQPTQSAFQSAIYDTSEEDLRGLLRGLQSLADVCSPLHENQENLVKCERLQENERVCKRLQTLVIPSRGGPINRSIRLNYRAEKVVRFLTGAVAGAVGIEGTMAFIGRLKAGEKRIVLKILLLTLISNKE